MRDRIEALVDDWICDKKATKESLIQIIMIEVRKFQIQSRSMAKLMPALKNGVGEDWARAAGGAICPTCRLEYIEHPVSTDADWLHILCDGSKVKL